MVWYPQAPVALTAFQACHRRLFSTCINNIPFGKMPVFVNICHYIYIYIYMFFTKFGKHQIDAERNSMEKSGRISS